MQSNQFAHIKLNSLAGPKFRLFLVATIVVLFNRMQPPGEDELFDSILDGPDSPPDDHLQSPPKEAVITVGSSSPASPGPSGQPIFSPVSSPLNMEVSQEHEDNSIG